MWIGKPDDQWHYLLGAIMAILQNTRNRDTDYVQLSFGTNGRAPLGMSLPNKDYSAFEPVHGVGGIVRRVTVRARTAGDSEIETCTIYFEDEGQERGTALQFSTGGPDKYSFAAGQLVAKLLACRPEDPLEIRSYVFKEGTVGKDFHQNEYIRSRDEMALSVRSGGQKILQPNWGENEDGTVRTQGPDAPRILNPRTQQPTEARDFTEAREWMVGALNGLKLSFNRNHRTEYEAQSAPISADDLPDSYDLPDAHNGSAGQSQYQRQRG
jgi:hypothetical protein